MSERSLKIISYVYLIIPIIIFLIGWVNLKFALLPILFLITILIRKIKEKSEKNLFVSKKFLLYIFLIINFICILGGLGGLYYQSSDWHCRNAIFRDLINNDWPVYYEKSNSALSYYIAIWMFPAIIRKIFFNIIWRIYCLEDC